MSPATIQRALDALLLVLTALSLGCQRDAKTPERELGQPKTEAPVGDRAHGGVPLGDSSVFADVAGRTLPAVVSVASTRAVSIESREIPFDFPFPPFFGPRGRNPFQLPPGEAPMERGLGSGVLVAKDVIITNAHVVEGADEIVVTASNRRVLSAKVVGSDPKSDLAVLRTTSDTTGITPLEFADSSAMRLGDMVLAVGSPFGLGGTVTMGIVSAKGRANLGIVAYEDFIQTDAAINPGNSGGALVDLQGKLVGIPTAILSRTGGNQGVGFAIPSNMAKPIMTSLLEHGRVMRGFLGVTIQTLDPELAKALRISESDGVLISGVTPGSPAAKAGLKVGDVVIDIDGKPVHSTGEFRNRIAAAGVKKTVELEIISNGRRERVRAVLGSAPDEPSDAARKQRSSNDSGRAGLALAPLDEAARARLDLPASIRSGVVVNAVAPGSPAAKSDLRAGDVLVEIDRQPATSPEQVAEVWSKARGPLAVLVWRDGNTFYAVLRR